MKKLSGMKFTHLILSVFVGLYMSCNYPSATTGNQNDELKFKEQPVTITWHGSSSDSIQSYQANVQVYSMNNRKDTGASLQQTYRLAVKTVDDRVYTRLDFDRDEQTASRSVVSNGDQMLIFDPATENVEYRIPLETNDAPLYKLLEQGTGVSRINLSLIREEAKRLALDMSEDTKAGQLVIDLPDTIFPQVGTDKITRRRAVFDTANDTLVSSEVVMARDDGTIVTTTVTPLYTDKDGTPIKIGMITVIDSKAIPSDVELDPDTPIYNAPEDIPLLSQEDFDRMVEAGNLNEMPDVTFGDPSDLSYTETIYEVYQDVEINAVDDQLFRLLH